MINKHERTKALFEDSECSHVVLRDFVKKGVLLLQ